jgi:molybdate transport system substrate-binding protein
MHTRFAAPRFMRRLWAGLLTLAALAPAHADTIDVAVAANFAAPMQAIAAAFERRSGHRVQITPGSTGKFYAQITNGAPFDVLLAADEQTPARLEQEGLAVKGTRRSYALGTLALWSADATRIDERGEVLKNPTITPLAIANPRVAPYGRAAMETLTAMKLDAAWASRLVQGESIAQTHQFVASGNAPLGFVALSQIMTEGRITSGSAWIVPDTLHTPIRQDAVLLLRAHDKPAARALLDYLASESARAVMRGYGYRF